MNSSQKNRILKDLNNFREEFSTSFRFSPRTQLLDHSDPLRDSWREGINSMIEIMESVLTGSATQKVVDQYSKKLVHSYSKGQGHNFCAAFSQFAAAFVDYARVSKIKIIEDFNNEDYQHASTDDLLRLIKQELENEKDVETEVSNNEHELVIRMPPPQKQIKLEMANCSIEQIANCFESEPSMLALIKERPVTQKEATASIGPANYNQEDEDTVIDWASPPPKKTTVKLENSSGELSEDYVESETLTLELFEKDGISAIGDAAESDAPSCPSMITNPSSNHHWRLSESSSSRPPDHVTGGGLTTELHPRLSMGQQQPLVRCPQCGASFLLESWLRKHLKICASIARICGASGSSSSSSNRRRRRQDPTMSTSEEEPMFACARCRCGFWSVEAQRVHEHDCHVFDGKAHACVHCGATYASGLVMTNRHEPLLDLHALSPVRQTREYANRGEARADLSSLVGTLADVPQNEMRALSAKKLQQRLDP